MGYQKMHNPTHQDAAYHANFERGGNDVEDDRSQKESHTPAAFL